MSDQMRFLRRVLDPDVLMPVAVVAAIGIWVSSIIAEDRWSRDPANFGDLKVSEITIRDRFAMLFVDPDGDPVDSARRAYKMADAMLATRSEVKR